MIPFKKKVNKENVKETCLLKKWLREREREGPEGKKGK